MVSTVTTTTVSTITTVAMVGSLGLVAVLTLLSLLIQKELIAVSEGHKSKTLVRALNIAIAPLLMSFALTMVVKVADALQ
jgi:uncharacterized BrkB/YihY/UPF0761 family membrane protein